MPTGVGSALDEVKERMVSNVEPPTARVEQGRIQPFTKAGRES